jgi:hypothetical protein
MNFHAGTAVWFEDLQEFNDRILEFRKRYISKSAMLAAAFSDAHASMLPEVAGRYGPKHFRMSGQ